MGGQFGPRAEAVKVFGQALDVLVLIEGPEVFRRWPKRFFHDMCWRRSPGVSSASVSPPVPLFTISRAPRRMRRNAFRGA